MVYFKICPRIFWGYVFLPFYPSSQFTAPNSFSDSILKYDYIFVHCYLSDYFNSSISCSFYQRNFLCPDKVPVMKEIAIYKFPNESSIDLMCRYFVHF
jgi:hypothetical protein